MGVLEEDMEQLGEAIITTVEAAWGDEFTSEEYAAFRKFMKKFTAAFAEGLEIKA